MTRRRAKAPTYAAGLDLDTNGARLALLSSDGSAHAIEALHETPLDPSWFADGTPRDSKAITAALRELLKDAGVRPTVPLHGSTANEPTILRLITPPPVPANQLATVLPYEIRKVLPLSEDEAEIRHQVLESRDGTRVLVGAVRRAHVSALSVVYSATRARYAGLEPRTLSALRSTLPPSDLPDILVIANATSSTITARHGPVLVANRVSDVGSDHLQNEPDEAARALIADMSEVAHTITDAFAPDFTITLIGAALHRDAFLNVLTQHFDRDPSALALAPELTGVFDATAHAPYLPAIGLALRGFAPSAPLDFRAQRRQRRGGSSSRALLPYLLVPAVAIGAFGYYSYLQNENARLQGEIATFAQRGREYDAITARYNQLLERQNRITSTLATVRHLTTTTVAYTDVVDRLIPRATQADDGAARGYLRTLTIDQANPLPIRDNADPTLEGTRFGVALGGTTRDAATIADIVAAFENDPSVEALFDRARTERGGEFDYEMRLAMVLPLPSASAPAPAEATAPTEDYLSGIPELPGYLESGLEAMGIDVTDVEDRM